MKKYLLFIFVLTCKNLFSQNTNVYDFAPSAKVTTNGTVFGGGATARSFSSATHLSVNQYIILDCGTPVPVSRITFGTFWSSDGRFIPNGYTIEYSDDGTTWSNIVTIPTNQDLSPSHNIGLEKRYWKLTITAVQAGQTVSTIAGLQLLNSGAGAATNNIYWNIGGYNSTSINYMAGNVGIGTTGPVSQLHLASNDNHALTISRGDGTYGFRIFRDAPAGSVYFQIGTHQNAWETKIKIGEGEGSNTKLLLNPDGGNVLIGKTSQTNTSYKLDINGNVRANKLVVNTTGADFVFEEDYSLRTLSELQKYIRQNKHLPEIPSAKEMEKDGLDIGDMNIKLLQKIEEMTLYIIAQNKKMQDLEKRIRNIESKK